MNRNAFRATATATVFAVALTLSGCNQGRQERWCELDETDEPVANSFCESGARGYEWEPDADKHKTKYVTKTKAPTPKPTPKPTTVRR